MALDLNALKSDIFNVLSALVSDDVPDDAKESALITIDEVSSGLAEAIDSFVKSGNYMSESDLD